jgi:uncharacterized protein YfbU (UPF0304 family)
MTPKTERIELRLDTGMVERIDEWRMRQADVPSRSEALRRLVEGGLEEHTPEGFRLNNTDKLTIWMLSKILENQIGQRQDQRDSKYDMKTINLIQEAIYGGHFWALGWELTGVIHEHVDDPKKVRAVVDILDMWAFVESAYKRFSKADKKRIEDEVGFRGKDPKFYGFDGNNETEYMSIARFLVEQLGRFEHFKGRDFNSHMPTVSRYLRMAEAFESIRKGLTGRAMSPDEVIQLLKLQEGGRDR